MSVGFRSAKPGNVQTFIGTPGKGLAYVRITKTGGVAKTKDINEARIYITTEKAKERLR